MAPGTMIRLNGMQRIVGIAFIRELKGCNDAPLLQLLGNGLGIPQAEGIGKISNRVYR